MSLLLAVATALSIGITGTAAEASPSQTLVEDPASRVNPLIGSMNGGNTFPGAVRPFGMLSWSPENSRSFPNDADQTRTAAPGGYRYDVTKIRGFSLTHLSGTGCAGASGDIPFYPHPGDVSTSPQADLEDDVYASSFSHEHEVARPGHYEVGLDSGVTAELAATTRTGSGRFTFPADKPATVLIRTSNSQLGSTDAHVDIDPGTRTVTGSVNSGDFCGYINPVGRRPYYTLYFAAVFDQPFAKVGTWKNDTVTPGSVTASGGTGFRTDGRPAFPAGVGSGAYVGFDSSTVTLRVGISYVSVDNARKNLAAENPQGTSFEQIRDSAYDAWRDQLRRIRIGGGTRDEQTTFYTALYHALLHPNVFSDVNGQYRGFDRQVHRVRDPQRTQYATFSGWDVYRSQIPLLALLEPEIAADVAQSLYNQASQNDGVWDRWTHTTGATHVMAGDPSAIAVSEIYAFGGRGFDAYGALRSLVTAATEPTALDLSRTGCPVLCPGQRPSLDKYQRLHYVPRISNSWGGAGETLEDAAADFAVAQFAGRLGESGTSRRFLARSQYWENLFNVGNGGYVQNREEDGTWPGLDPASSTGFAEGSSAQYTWMVAHNQAGLFEAMGGRDRAVKRLYDFFHNADGSWALTRAGGLHADLANEPSIKTMWLYNFLGEPHKTQEVVRQVMTTLWSNSPGGIPGNDDLGEMSAWYVWAALGTHPYTPSRAELVLAAPLFPQARIDLDGRGDITISAPAAATDVPYIKDLTVDGRASDKPWLPESFIGRGGHLDFTLTDTPNPAWGSDPADEPPSWRDGEPGYQAIVTSQVTAPPGDRSGPVTVDAQRITGGFGGLDYRTSAPEGLTVTPAAGHVDVDSTTGTGSTSFTVAVAAGTPRGFYDIDVELRTADGARLADRTVTVVVAPEGSLLSAVNNAGISDDAGTHDEATFDTVGWSYSRQALAAEGLAPGAERPVEGLTFTWPDVPTGRTDNVRAAGQILALPTGTTQLSFVGSAHFGNRAATAKLTYTDGTTEEIPLAFGDWTLAGGTTPVPYENRVLARTPYRNRNGGETDLVTTYIFATKPFTVPAGRQVASVTLPVENRIHVFAIATG